MQSWKGVQWTNWASIFKKALDRVKVECAGTSAPLIMYAWETSVLWFLGYNIMEAESEQEMNLVSLFSFCLSSLWTELCLKVIEIFI